MRIVAVSAKTGQRVAARTADRLFDLGPGDLWELIGAPEIPPAGPEIYDLVEFRPPLVPGKIVCVGHNYAAHVAEAGRSTPAQPVIFAKWPSSVSACGQPIVIDPRLTSAVDWEGELAVILKAPLRHASETEAMEAIFGYTVANDVSARDIQRIDGQWTRAKSLDTFGPLGPTVVTPDEVDDVQALSICTRVNGEVMQEGSTSDMLFGVAELLVFCSRSFSLEAGDVLLTGTPPGCGAFMHPPRFLADGDEVEVEIEGIGVLRNVVEVLPERTATSKV